MDRDDLPDPIEQIPAWRQELLRRREAGEISPYDFDLNYLWYLKDMGPPDEMGNPTEAPQSLSLVGIPKTQK